MKFCTYMAYIFVGSYTKFEVDGSVRYRDIAINVKSGQKIVTPAHNGAAAGIGATRIVSHSYLHLCQM